MFRAQALLGLWGWVSGELPGGGVRCILTMLPDSPCFIPDLGRDSQSWRAAEPGLCQCPTGNLEVQCPGGHRHAHL